MKKCLQCNSEVPNESKFCPNCGSGSFDTPSPQQEVQQSPQQEVQQSPQQEVQQGFKPYISEVQTVKKRLKWWQGVLIVLAVAFVAVALTVLVKSSCGKSEISSTVLYSKGFVFGSTYTNEWADMRIEIPEGFSEADESNYSVSENSVTDCGLFIMSDDSTQLITVQIEKLPTSNYTAEAYLTACMNNLSKQESVIYDTNNNYNTETIGGYDYAVAKIGLKNLYGSFKQNMYARKIDDRMVLITVVGLTHEDNDELVKIVQPN